MLPGFGSSYRGLGDYFILSLYKYFCRDGTGFVRAFVWDIRGNKGTTLHCRGYDLKEKAGGF